MSFFKLRAGDAPHFVVRNPLGGSDVAAGTETLKNEIRNATMMVVAIRISLIGWNVSDFGGSGFIEFSPA